MKLLTAINPTVVDFTKMTASGLHNLSTAIRRAGDALEAEDWTTHSRSTFDYKYDNVGNRLGVLEASGARVTWVYDNSDRLIAERRTGANSYANTFTYDASGNRTVKNADNVRTTFNYDVESLANVVRLLRQPGTKPTLSDQLAH